MMLLFLWVLWCTKAVMADRYKPLLDREFLRAELDREYLNYRDDHDDALLERLTRWRASKVKRETQAEDSFTQRFFVETWGYRQTGTGGEFELLPKFMIPGSGAGGQAGEADLVVGLFGGKRPSIPQGRSASIRSARSMRTWRSRPSHAA